MVPGPQTLSSATSPIPYTVRDLHTTVPQHNATVVPFKLSDIGEGIAEVTIKEWYVM